MYYLSMAFCYGHNKRLVQILLTNRLDELHSFLGISFIPRMAASKMLGQWIFFIPRNLLLPQNDRLPALSHRKAFFEKFGDAFRKILLGYNLLDLFRNFIVRPRFF